MKKSIETARKINAEEIQKLYEFTRQHYAEYYDLQTELVDHLATGMEETWQDNPHLSFEQNLNQEFKKFGVFGFMEAIESHQKAMSKKYWKILKRETLQHLTRTKIILGFILIFGLCYASSQYIIGLEILRISLLILAVAGLIVMFRQRKKLERKKAKNQRIYLLETMITQSQFNGIMLSLPFQIMLNFSYSENFGNLQAIIIALVISLTFLLFYITNTVLPKKKEDILKEVYPERKFV